MAEVGKATVKIVPDATGFAEALEDQVGGQLRSKAMEFVWSMVGLLLLVCSPAIVWAVYGWAF